MFNIVINRFFHRHCYLLPGSPVQRHWKSYRSPPAPVTASLPLHPPRAFFKCGHTQHRLAGVGLPSTLEDAGRGHMFRFQSVVQSRVSDGPYPGVSGLRAGAWRHLSGLLAALFWRVNSQQREQQAECGVTHRHKHTRLYEEMHFCDAGTSIKNPQPRLTFNAPCCFFQTKLFFYMMVCILTMTG